MLIRNNKAQLSLIITIVVLFVIGFVIFLTVYNKKGAESTGTSTSSENEEEIISPSESPRTYTIEITSNGFSPSNLEIKKSDRVVWINKDSAEHWPASAMHPTHTIYAGGHYDEAGSYQGSQACKSEGEAKTGAFDTCHGLIQGESWSFTFNEKGSWGFHDHLVSGKFGKIIVN